MYTYINIMSHISPRYKYVIFYFRCTYNQEAAKVRLSMVTGSGTHDVYVPKLSWFTFADKFLKKNNDEERESDSNFVSFILII